MAIEEVPVLVVGAGLTGLSTAVFLARQGIRPLLVEREHTLPHRDDSTLTQPEAVRLLGVAGVRVHATNPDLLTRLRDRAAALGTEIRLDTELVWLDQGPIGVTAHLRDHTDGREYPVYADYLVGADGEHGSIREQLGVRRHRIDRPDNAPDSAPDDNPYDSVDYADIWAADTWAAETFRDERIFLAGTAAHGATHNGGTVVRDAFDLGWKLAAVLQGQAGPGLLDSYDTERRPTREPHPTPGRTPPSSTTTTATTPATTPTTTPARPSTESAEPDGSPGSPAPSVALWRNGTTVSTLDYFDGRWVVLTGVEGGLWHSAAHAVAGRLGVPLVTVGLGPELVDVADELPSRYGIGLSGASLVRPDGVVAWRCDTEPPDPARTLDQVLRGQLSR